MTWNYRIIRSQDPDGSECFALHEVYYDGEGRPETYTERPCGFVGESPEAVRGALEMALAAFTEPVLTEADFHVEEPC